MDTPITGPFELRSQRLGALPLLNHFLARTGLAGLLGRYLPADDARHRLAPAVAVRLVITNLLVGRQPLYGLGEWAGPFAPGLLGLAGAQVESVNDDWVGRALERLFDADRASLLTELLLGVVAEFGIDVSECHNDSTSISVHGLYRSATGAARGGKPTPQITFGHSKDHRPDLKQLVFILTVAADGAVPIAYRLADGNTTDDPTAPSAERILEIFADLTRHELHRNGQLVQTFEPELSPLQQQVLDLLAVPATNYTTTRPTEGPTEGGRYCPPEVRNVR